MEEDYNSIVFVFHYNHAEMETFKRGSGVTEYYEVTATPSDWWKCFKEGYKPDSGWTEVSPAY